jgi:hypothetical protein
MSLQNLKQDKSLVNGNFNSPRASHLPEATRLLKLGLC